VFKNLINLQALNLSFCEKLTSIDVLKGLNNLQNLNIEWCENLTSIDALKDFKNLQTLSPSKNQFPTNAINELQKQLPQMQISYE
jgi:hypothetical protein